MKTALLWLSVLSAVSFAAGCSSMPYKTQKYAQLSNSKDFEDEFPVVWKATVTALADFKIEKKDQEKGVIETDWVYSTSTEKYIEYQVDGFPRKKYLQDRYRYRITMERAIGKVHVTVTPEEELEKLKADGSSDGWQSVSEMDTQRASDMINTIQNQILSMPDALKPQH